MNKMQDNPPEYWSCGANGCDFEHIFCNDPAYFYYDFYRCKRCKSEVSDLFEGDSEDTLTTE